MLWLEATTYIYSYREVIHNWRVIQVVMARGHNIYVVIETPFTAGG